MLLFRDQNTDPNPTGGPNGVYIITLERDKLKNCIEVQPRIDGNGIDQQIHENEDLSPANSEKQLCSVDSSDTESLAKRESTFAMISQVAIPFFIAGCGTIMAGVTLGKVQNWEVFLEISTLMVLVPSLLGLKGNLDMCLGSRLSTQANLGNMSDRKEVIHMIVGNIAVVQVQAIIAATIVSIIAIVLNMGIVDREFNMEHCTVLIVASVCTATTTCFILDFLMIFVIMVSKRCNMNPDNFATPVAASVGDLLSIICLSNIASVLYNMLDEYQWVLYVIFSVYILIFLPLWTFFVLKNRYTKSVLYTGWTPVFTSLAISAIGGYVLGFAVDRYSGFVVFQPIINGIGGNLVSVQASRMSTMLHQVSSPGVLPFYASTLPLPWNALFRKAPSSNSARILIFMSIPGQAFFLFAADFFHQHFHSTIVPEIVASYLFASSVQIMILLYVAHILVHFLWSKGIDPDNSAIPFLTALGDVLGTTLLLLAFLFLSSIGIEYD